MELLTTGQMIDKLKVGDIAEFTDCAGVKFKEQKITRNNNGVIWKDNGNTLEMNNYISKLKWRIIPNYVSYDKALRAHKEQKKTIIYHHNNEFKYVFKHELETGQFDQLAKDNICLYELLEGKWTIED